MLKTLYGLAAIAAFGACGDVDAAVGTEDRLIDAFWRVCVAPGFAPESATQAAAAAAGARPTTLRHDRTMVVLDLPVGDGVETLRFDDDDCRLAAGDADPAALLAAFDRRAGGADMAGVRRVDTTPAADRARTRKVEFFWPGQARSLDVDIGAHTMVGVQSMSMSRKYGSPSSAAKGELAASSAAGVASGTVPDVPGARWRVIGGNGGALAYDSTRAAFTGKPNVLSMLIATYTTETRVHLGTSYRFTLEGVQFDCSSGKRAVMLLHAYDAAGTPLGAAAVEEGKQQWFPAMDDSIYGPLMRVGCSGQPLPGETILEAGTTHLLPALRAAAR